MDPPDPREVLMTGPEHYREAEVLLADANPPDEESRWDMALLAAAQVHATLALTAATALGGVTLTLPQDSRLAAGWNDAIGVTP